MCTDSSSGQILGHQHWISGPIPSNSLHLLSCAQIIIVNQERVVDAPSCCVVLFLPHLVLLVSDADRISLLLVRNVHTSCGKERASVRVPEPPADWAAWVEEAVVLFLLVHQLHHSLDHHPVCPENFYTSNSLFFINQIYVKRLQPIRQRITIIRFALDVSSSATLSSTSLKHNSASDAGFLIALTSVVNAVPAVENADQCFDHCSFVWVPQSSPWRTHRFPVATKFFSLVCLFWMYNVSYPLLSWSETSLLPFFASWLTDPRALFTLATWSHGSSLLAVKCTNIQFSLSFIVHFAAIGCCVEIICSWTIGVCQKMVCRMTGSQAQESTTRGFGNGAQVFCWSSHRSVLPFTKKLMSASVRLALSVLLKLAQVRIALLETDVCICHSGKTYTWLLGGEISRSLPLSDISLTTSPFVTDIVFQVELFWFFVSVLFFWVNKKLMFVLVDVRPLMWLSLATCLTGTHQSLHLTVSSWVDISITRPSYCFESPSKLFVPAGPLLLPTFDWSVPNFTPWPSHSDCANLCCHS